MSTRATLRTFVIVAVLALAGLLVAGAAETRNLAFSLNVPDNAPEVWLPAGETLCQGPITARSSFTGIQTWAQPVSSLVVQIRSPRSGAVELSRRVAHPPDGGGILAIGLGHRRLRAGARFTVCFRNTAARRIAFEDGPPSGYSGHYRISGRRAHNAIPITFTRSDAPSLLSLLPTVFRRASLLKAGWAGPWTFWVLLAGLLGAFALAGWAVRAAFAAELADWDAPERPEGGR